MNDLANNRVENEGAKHLSRLPSLTILLVCKLYICLANNNIGFEGAASISKLNKLHKLRISGNNITN